MADRNSLYGTGFQYPVQLDPSTGGVASAVAVDSVRASLRRLFDTTPGSDRFNPAYGCGLTALLFEQDTVTLRALLDAVVRDAVRKWEPRIAAIISLDISADETRENTLNMTVSFQLIQSATVSNFVYPFATQPG